MDFDELVKYSGFLVTVITLVTGIDYFLHKIWLSIVVVAGVTILFLIFYYRVIHIKKSLFDLKILTHEVTVDILDIKGELAIHSRKTKFEALKNKVTTFTDHMSADGEFIDPEVSPGLIEEIRKEGGDLFVRTNFGKVLNKGDIIEKTIKAKLKNSFVNNPEYWSVRIILPTKEFKLIVVFPRDRPYKNFRGYQRVTSHEKVFEIQPVETLINGRPALTWTVKHPELKDVYKLVWDW